MIGEGRALQTGSRIQSALDAELGGTGGMGLSGALLEAVAVVPVGTVLAGIAAKGAEAAVLDAVIADVEIAIHHVGDRVAHRGLAPTIGLSPQTFRSRLLQELQREIPAAGAGGIGGESIVEGPLPRRIPWSWDRAPQGRWP